MLASLSSNAVSAKARGMHGKRLTNNNFMDLLNCKTVHDVAYYLKNRTSYNKLLAGINENEVSRSELEVLLKQKIFDDCSDLGRYGASVGAVSYTHLPNAFPGTTATCSFLSSSSANCSDVRPVLLIHGNT